MPSTYSSKWQHFNSFLSTSFQVSNQHCSSFDVAEVCSALFVCWEYGLSVMMLKRWTIRGRVPGECVAQGHHPGKQLK